MTADDVKQLAREKGISLIEAKRLLDRIEMLHQINDAKTINDVRPILLKLLDKTYE